MRLGRDFCLAFANAGWNVVCHFQSSVEEAAKTCTDVIHLGRKAVAVEGDISNSSEREAIFTQATDATGTHGLGAIINNASVFEPDAGIDFSSETLRRQLEVNTIAPLHLGSMLARAEQTRIGGIAPTIIHILDQKVFNLNPDYFSYTVSKLALERTVALQAQALAPRVRVAGIAPGLIYVSGPQGTVNFDLARTANLMRCPTDSKDVAQTAVFLAQNPSITGVTVCVDNGQHLIPSQRDIMFVTELLLEKENKQ